MQLRHSPSFYLGITLENNKGIQGMVVSWFPTCYGVVFVIDTGDNFRVENCFVVTSNMPDKDKLKHFSLWGKFKFLLHQVIKGKK